MTPFIDGEAFTASIGNTAGKNAGKSGTGSKFFYNIAVFICFYDKGAIFVADPEITVLIDSQSFCIQTIDIRSQVFHFKIESNFFCRTSHSFRYRFSCNCFSLYFQRDRFRYVSPMLSRAYGNNPDGRSKIRGREEFSTYLFTIFNVSRNVSIGSPVRNRIKFDGSIGFDIFQGQR